MERQEGDMRWFRGWRTWIGARTCQRAAAVLIVTAGLVTSGCGGDGALPDDAGASSDSATDRDASATDRDASASQDAHPAPALHGMSPAELHAALQSKDFLLINVHVPDQGEIPGTDTHIPYTDVDAIAAYIGPDLGTKTVIYCLTDHMALIAGPALVQRGYWNLYYIEGGMSAWQAAGYTVDPYP